MIDPLWLLLIGMLVVLGTRMRERRRKAEAPIDISLPAGDRVPRSADSGGDRHAARLASARADREPTAAGRPSLAAGNPPRA